MGGMQTVETLWLMGRLSSTPEYVETKGGKTVQFLLHVIENKDDQVASCRQTYHVVIEDREKQAFALDFLDTNDTVLVEAKPLLSNGSSSLSHSKEVGSVLMSKNVGSLKLIVKRTTPYSVSTP